MKSNLLLKIMSIILAVAVAFCATGWVRSAKSENCIGVAKAEIIHCDTYGDKCYFYVVTDDGISDSVSVPLSSYALYDKGDTILVNVMANRKGEKNLLFSEENP